MATTYEFVVETLSYYEGCDGEPDIIDCPAFDTLPEATTFAETCKEPWRIALRRDRGSEDAGLTERDYAYPDENGRLPERMETATGMQDGPAVPARFRQLVFPVCRCRCEPA